MWKIKDVRPVKLIVGILACDEQAMEAAVRVCQEQFGATDSASETWVFDQTQYYRAEMGENLLRRFISFGELIDPGRLAGIKHRTNELEQELARELNRGVERPVNLDPGYMEPSKLVLASAKNFSHRIYIGRDIHAEITLIYEHGWKILPWTFPDYRLPYYQEYFSKVRDAIVAQLRQLP